VDGFAATFDQSVRVEHGVEPEGSAQRALSRGRSGGAQERAVALSEEVGVAVVGDQQRWRMPGVGVVQFPRSVVAALEDAVHTGGGDVGVELVMCDVEAVPGGPSRRRPLPPRDVPASPHHLDGGGPAVPRRRSTTVTLGCSPPTPPAVDARWCTRSCICQRQGHRRVPGGRRFPTSGRAREGDGHLGKCGCGRGPRTGVEFPSSAR
jgi:hypothetical protein